MHTFIQNEKATLPPQLISCNNRQLSPKRNIQLKGNEKALRTRTNTTEYNLLWEMETKRKQTTGVCNSTFTRLSNLVNCMLCIFTVTIIKLTWAMLNVLEITEKIVKAVKVYLSTTLLKHQQVYQIWQLV